jgi:ferric-chelate reductase [NAD(P)H]
MNRKALHKISYGLYVVSSVKGGKFNGQIANAVFQVTATPPKVAVSINRENLTHSFIESSGVFSVSVLSRETPMVFIGLFGFRSGRDVDKFENVDYDIGATGAPIVKDHAVAWMETRVTESVNAGTHTVFIGEILDADLIKDEDVMTYEHYHSVLRGRAPKAAPTHMEV